MCDLRQLIAEDRNLPIENLRLILQGNVLQDSSGNGEDVFLKLKDGGMGLFLFSFCFVLLWKLAGYIEQDTECAYLITLHLYRQHVWCLDGMRKWMCTSAWMVTIGTSWNHLCNPVRLSTHQCEFSLHMHYLSQLGLPAIMYIIIQFNLIHTNVNFCYIWQADHNWGFLKSFI